MVILFTRRVNVVNLMGNSFELLNRRCCESWGRFRGSRCASFKKKKLLKTKSVDEGSLNFLSFFDE